MEMPASYSRKRESGFKAIGVEESPENTPGRVEINTHLEGGEGLEESERN